MYLDPAPNQLDATLYEIPINGLCDNARLNFSLWAADLQQNYAHPAFEMQLLNAEDTSLLVRSFVVNVPRNNPFTWHQYGFPTLSQTMSTTSSSESSTRKSTTSATTGPLTTSRSPTVAAKPKS